MTDNNEKTLSVIDYGTLTGIEADVLDKADSWEDFVSIWMRVKEAEQYTQFLKGDIAYRVAVKFGENTLSKFAQEVGEKPDTLIAYRRVARAFPADKRGLNLTWTHYLIASHTDSWGKSEGKFISDNRFNWAEKANDEGWSTHRMAQEIKTSGALKETISVFEYYSAYLDKVRNVLLHLDKEKLSKEEKVKLAGKAEALSFELQEYFKIDASGKTEPNQKKAMLSVIGLIDRLEKRQPEMQRAYA